MRQRLGPKGDNNGTDATVPFCSIECCWPKRFAQSSVKSAAEKSAGPTPSDPGGYQGASSHPTTSVDNNVQKAEEGERAREYEADLKKQQGPVGVDSTPETFARRSAERSAAQHWRFRQGHRRRPGRPRKITRVRKMTRALPTPPRPTTARSTAACRSRKLAISAATLGNDILANLINFER
jgi:hypothetical protein